MNVLHQPLSRPMKMPRLQNQTFDDIVEDGDGIVEISYSASLSS